MTSLTSALIRSACLILAAAVTVSGTRGQDEKPVKPRPAVPSELQAKINRAIDLGVESLLARQAIDGSWTQQIEGYGPGMTGLALYALMKSGLSPEHPAVARGFTFLERQEATKTYTRSTVLLAVTTRGAKKDKAWVEELTEDLIRSQDVRGWGYPSGEPDLSNTQFAATALRAAVAYGVAVPPKVWSRLTKSTLECLEPDGESTSSGDTPRGFRYRKGHEVTTGSMSAAGVAILSICSEQMRKIKPAHARGIKRGMAWLTEHFAVQHNPAPARDNGSNGPPHYFLYGLERVGSLRGVETFGPYPWYQLGAEWLVGAQKDDGSWEGQSSTAFGLLFLARATGSFGPSSGSGGLSSRWSFGTDSPKDDVSIRASGRTALTIWVSSLGERMTAKWATGEDGEGPVPVARVEYWLLGPGKEETLLQEFRVDDIAEGLRKRFAIQSDLTGPRTCRIQARVFLEGRTKPYLSKPLEVRIGMAERSTWNAYESDHTRNLLAGAKVDVTASSAKEGPRAQAINVVDGYVGLGWKPTQEDKSPWIKLEPGRPISANTILLSHGEMDGTLLGRLEIIVNDKPKDALSEAMVQDVREKTVIALPKTVRVRTLELRFLDPIAGDCAGLGEVELQRRR